MSYVRVWLHAVWGTKNREHILTPDVRETVIRHIKNNAKQKGIYIDRLNGASNHLHCLIGLNADMTIAKTMQFIKGESAYWINKNRVIPTTFVWADEYFAASVSESVLDDGRIYIDNQEERHRKTSFPEEVDKLIQTYKLEYQG